MISEHIRTFAQIERQVKNPTGILADSVTMVAQDASKIASGMQRMRLECGRWVTVVGSMVYFSHAETLASSTLREILGSFRAIKNMVKPTAAATLITYPRRRLTLPPCGSARYSRRAC